MFLTNCSPTLPICAPSLSASASRTRRRRQMADGSREQEAIDTAQGLTAALKGPPGERAAMRRELAASNAYGHRTRRFIAVLAVSFVCDIALTIFVAVF